MMAGKAVGNIRISLTAATEKFSKSMRSAGKSVKTFSLNAAKNIAKFSAGVVASLGAVGAAFAALGKKSADLLDRIGKQSDILGISTKKFAGFAVAARRAGISQETLIKSLKRMVDAISEANTGLGTAKVVLEELGVDIAKLNRLDPAEQMRVLATALRGVSNQADRIRIGSELFGQRGLDLLLLTNDALDDAQKFANKYNLAIERFDIAKVEAANDAWGDVGDAITGIGNKIAVLSAEPMRRLANAILNIKFETDDTAFAWSFVGDAATAALARMIAGLQELPNLFKRVVLFAKKLELGWEVLLLQAQKLANFQQLIVSGGRTSGTGTELAEKRIRELSVEVLFLEASIDGSAEAAERFQSNYEAALNILRNGLASATRQFATGGDPYAEFIDDTVESTEQLAQKFEETFEDRIAGSIESGIGTLAQSLINGENALQSFASFVANIASEISSNLLKSFLTDGAGGGFIGTIAGGISSAFGFGGGDQLANSTSAGIRSTGAGDFGGGGGQQIININGAKGNKEVLDLVNTAIDSRSNEIENRAVAKVTKLNANNPQLGAT